MYNPIIFLKWDYNVPKEDIRKVWRLQYKRGKWIPIEIHEAKFVEQQCFKRYAIGSVLALIILNEKIGVEKNREYDNKKT